MLTIILNVWLIFNILCLLFLMATLIITDCGTKQKFFFSWLYDNCLIDCSSLRFNKWNRTRRIYIIINIIGFILWLWLGVNLLKEVN